MINDLINIGLSEKEARIYIALLEVGKSSVQDLAKKAKVNRATVYVILDKLMDLGLASKYDEKKKTYFVAESPERLISVLDLKKKEIDLKGEELKKILPKLKKIRQKVEEDGPVVKYFEGKEGMSMLVKEMLKTTKGNKIRMFYNADKLPRFFSKEERNEFKNIRRKRNINVETIYISDLVTLEEKSKGDVRIKISTKEFPSECDIAIYSNEIRIASFAKKDPIGIIIKDKSIQKTFLSLFKLAWEGAKHKKIK